MSLTSLRLILLAATATLAAGAATVRWWSRGGRLSPVGRTAGVLLLEVLTVLTAALVVNRHEQFYPSWRALRGDTGTVAVTGSVRPGLLDARLRSGGFAWRPTGVHDWRLKGTPAVTIPADYLARPDVTFPVVLALVAPGTPARRTPGAVTVTIAPTARTTASALLTLPAALSRDLRVTTVGWDVQSSGPLGAAFVAAAPAGLAVLDQPAGALPPALAAPQTLPSARS
jgi:hypothetical protein